MNITSNSDKRVFICAAWILPSNLFFSVDYPGNYIKVNNDIFTKINFSDISFSETDTANGELIEQVLQFTFRGQNKNFDINVLNIGYSIIKIDYSNGDSKIIGTVDNPVVFTRLKSGRIVENVIESRRQSAEPAKYIIA